MKEVLKYRAEMDYSELSRIDFSRFYKDIMSYSVSLRDKLVERYIKTFLIVMIK